jgi:ketosteroid isomerase-like protein
VSEERELIVELARRFQSGDRSAAMALFHPDIRVEQPPTLPHGGCHVGLDGVDRMGAEFGRFWDRTIEDPRIFGCEGTVVQLTTQTWTAKATGRQATVDVVELFGFADGLISEIRVFQQDTHLLMGLLDPS